MRVSRNVLSSVLAIALTATACSHAPEARLEQPRQEPADIAGIGPRPKVFGRHAWDAAQKRAAARLATANAPAQPARPVTPPAPAQAAMAPAPAPAAPPVAVAAPPSAPAPEPVAPQIAAAPAPAVAPAPIEKPKVARTPKPVQLAEAPAKKGPSLWQRITTPPPAPVQPPIVGGYGPAGDKDAVAAAAAFAVHESPGYVLKAVYSAKVQVVAGTNYSLCLWVRRPTLEPNPLHRRMVAATVFQGLDGHRELTAWKEVGTCHAGAQPE